MMLASSLLDPFLACVRSWPPRHPRLPSPVRRSALRALHGSVPEGIGGPGPAASPACRQLPARTCVTMIATASFGLWFGILKLAVVLA